MTAEENKKIINEYFEIFNTRDVLAIDRITDQLFPPTWISHSPGPHDREGRKQMIHQIFEDYPDFQMISEDRIAENDKVVTRGRYIGIHAQTKEQFHREFIGIARFSQGMVVEVWELMVPVSTP